MLKCTPEAVGLADKWVEQMALTGPTNMRAGLQDVVSYRMADCVYLVSDGRADNPLSVLEFIADQVRVSCSCYGKSTVPRIQRDSGRTAALLPTVERSQSHHTMQDTDQLLMARCRVRVAR
jgi:hypothetical protein